MKNAIKNTMKELPEEQRPYEKCYSQGPSVLTDSELLAVILRNGTQGNTSLMLADSVISHMNHSSYPGLIGILHSTPQELMKVHGIGKVKAIQLKCIGELSKRIAAAHTRENLSFRDPVTIADYYMEKLRHEEQELMVSMMLDSKNHLIGEQILTRGTVNMTLITPREVFVEALQRKAVSIILIHNHPSGDPVPSDPDMQITARVAEAGELVGIPLLDHIIIGDHRYFSFLEEGIIGKSDS